MEFYIGQIFIDSYPVEAVNWFEKRQDCYITEIEPQEGNRRFQIVAVPEPTEQERLMQSYRAELAEKEQWLRDHDYIGTKIATGRATAEEYADEIATMTEYASRVEELRALMAELEAG